MSGFESRAVTAWGRLIHAIFGHKCAMCGTAGEPGNPLEAHHIDGGNNLLTKFLIELGILLCQNCHKNDPEKAPHKNSEGFEIWLATKFPDKYTLWQSLRYKMVMWYEIDIKEICKNLEKMTKQAA